VVGGLAKIIQGGFNAAESPGAMDLRPQGVKLQFLVRLNHGILRPAGWIMNCTLLCAASKQ